MFFFRVRKVPVMAMTKSHALHRDTRNSLQAALNLQPHAAQRPAYLNISTTSSVTLPTKQPTPILIF